jgi:hypothetical protein
MKHDNHEHKDAASEVERYRTWFYALMLAHVALVWLLPVLPAQDLPQHLTNARILLELQRPDLPFRDYYVRAGGIQSYFSSYHLLVALGRLMPLESALRLVFSGYVVGLFFAFQALVRQINPMVAAERPPWTALLAALLVWNPVACMGFFAFTLAIPVLVAAVAWFIKQCEAAAAPVHGWLLLGLFCLLAASLHVVAALALLAFYLGYAILSPSRRRLQTLAVSSGMLLAALAGWMVVGDRALAAAPLELDEAFRENVGIEFLSKAFRIDWGSPLTKLNYVLWNVLGPLRWSGQLVSALVLTAAATLAFRQRGQVPEPEQLDRQRALRRGGLALFVLSLLAPWGLYAPSEVTFLDFRLMTVALVVLAAAVPLQRFSSPVGGRSLALACALLTLHLGGRAFAFGREAQGALNLVRRAEPGGLMLTLAFNNVSRHFGRQFQLTHFLPMYYTVRRHGINSQFWAGYTEHLPVTYRESRRPPGPPDWRPWEVTSAQIDGTYDFVLLERADPARARAHREGSLRAERLLRQWGKLAGCDGQWCLYDLRRPSPVIGSTAAR